jgi:hypothetical protein
VRKVGVSAFVVGAALVCGLATLLLATIIMFVAGGGFSSAIVRTCTESVTIISSGVTHRYGHESCTPQSPWALLPGVIGILGVALGGIWATHFIHRRRPATG